MDSNAKHDAPLSESVCSILDWGWNYGESFELGASQLLLSMRLLQILFIGIEIGIDQVFGGFLFYRICVISESIQHGHLTVHSRKRQSVSLKGFSNHENVLHGSTLQR